MLKSFLSFLLLSWLATPLFSQQMIHRDNVAEAINPSGRRIILFGENHYVKGLQDMYYEYTQILNREKISTVFLEGPYSSYIVCKLGGNDNYMNCKYMMRDTSLNIVTIDVEEEPVHALHAIWYIYCENDLYHTAFFRENEARYDYYRKNGAFDKQKMLQYIDNLEKKVAPKIKKYHAEFLHLLRNMRITYEVIEPEDLDRVAELPERDSLMAAWIEEYVAENNITAWAGIFGSFHVTQDSDKLFIPVGYDNMLTILLKNQKAIRSRSEVLCIVYDCWHDLSSEDYVIESYKAEYDLHGPKLKRKQLIFDDRKRDLVFLISKR